MATILTKKSDTSSSVPLAADLTNAAGGAELAVNTSDKRLYTKTSGGSVVEVGTNPSSLTLPNGTANGVPYLNGSKVLTSGSALTFDGTNLGIGTSSPATSLYVYRTATDAVGTFQGLQTSSGGTGKSAIQLDVNGKGGFAISNDATSGTRALTFSNNSGYGVSTVEAMRIDSNGNVGIGTSSPTAGGKLDVNGIAYFGTGDKVKIYSNNVLQTAGTLDVGTIGSAALILNTANTERARIDSSGNLLVGTTTQRDGAKITNEFTTGNNGISLYCVANTSAVDFAVFRANAGALCGNIARVGTTNAVTYASASDYRLKENIAPMIGALEKVAKLKPVTYNWKDGGAHADGFIAHELAEVCPSAVVGEKDAVDAEGNPKYQSIDTSFLVATLTAAIQEQQAIITALTARVTALETN